MLPRLFALAALLCALVAAPLTAQTEAPAETSSNGASSALSSLLEVLKDDTARADLIAELEAATGTAPAEDPAPEAAPPSVAQAVAETTSAATKGAVTAVQRASDALLDLGLLQDGLMSRGGDLAAPALALLMTIASTIVIAVVAGGAAARFARRIDPPPGAHSTARLRAVGLASLARLGALILAWTVGYLLATFVFGQPGAPGAEQLLYLNAFAAFGFLRLLLRAIVSPRADDEPALSVLAPGAQAIVYRALRRLAAVVVQGMLFVVPLAQMWAGYPAARSVRTLVATLALVLALLGIRRIARALDAAQGDRPRSRRHGEAGAAVAQGAQALWRAIWPPLALAYVLYAWVVTVTRPSMIEEIVIGGTLYSLGGLATLLLGLRLMHTAPGVRAPLPASLAQALPRLQPRADALAATFAWVVAIAAVALALLLAVSGWTRLDPATALGDPTVQAVLWRIASAALVALFAAALWAIVASWIDHRLNADVTTSATSARSRTLLALFRNAFTIAVAIFAAMLALSQLGIDIAPLIAGAGVIGLAIGFGSQKLVQDIITGVFIQLENAINEGDVVTVAGITGGVEKVTIRSVTLRALDGTAHIVPFSSVDTVSNLTRDFAFHVAEIGAAYKESVPDVKAAMEEAFERLKAEEFGAQILEPLDMHGVIELGDSAVVIRARIKTRPGQQWGVGRRYTELVKDVMDERGLEIPFPHRQLVLPPGLLLPPQRTIEGEATENNREIAA